MKYKIIVFIIIFFQLFSIFAQEKRSDSLLFVLDETIRNHGLYKEIKERRIDSLSFLLQNEPDIEQRFLIYENLYEEYRRYNMHRALSIAEKKLLVAQEMNNEQFEYLSMLRIGEIYGIMGMHEERMKILNGINREQLDEQHWAYYFHLYHSYYLRLSESASIPARKQYYENLVNQYKDSILQVIDQGDLGYKIVMSGKLIGQKRYDEALSIINTCFHLFEDNPTSAGMINFIAAGIYEIKGDIEKQKEHLAVSAITDLRLSVTSYIALRQLAVLLFNEGDVNRAYSYIKRSLEDAIYSGSQFRVLEVSEMLPIIANAYNLKMRETNEKLLKSLIFIVVLFIVLILSTIIICFQMKKLSKAKKSISDMYTDMKQLNVSFDDLNKKLSESNQIKEEYIGSVFSLCSSYINKMETYRIQINRKIKANQYDDIRRQTSTSLIANEQKELFANFDAIFLNLYPKFIEQFNLMLNEEEQIIPKSDDILTPELRVYALIRLGITDSGNIASFLHYSPQTVYNYKIKVKNRLKIPKEMFSEAVREIGR